ncbi:hypothetical protein [uncultured Eubacterium sp.]|uniref:hypothetical protein n=1 Tax=uncultured Eubacterium sp. TaxID=165185 RepID=UPI00260044C9|nr:hypothetical protein [uncultured Eubacterium sp.]
MIFEVGKCYEHTNGLKLRILADVVTCAYGRVFIAEDNYGRITPQGIGEESSLNYVECEDFMKTVEETGSYEAVVMPAAEENEIDVSEMNPDAVEVKPDDVEDEEMEATEDEEKDETD